ncbi:16802_t:CDS:2, partial [Gigaspora rosea]
DIPQRIQNPVEKQLAVVLYRLESKATIWDICSKFGIAEGTKVHKGFEEMCSFSNVIGVLDGSHLNLFEAPSKLNKDIYFTQKLFRNSNLYHCRNQLFEGNDYILADSAYPILPYIIPSFKDPSDSDKDRQTLFNKKHSKSH